MIGQMVRQGRVWRQLNQTSGLDVGHFGGRFLPKIYSVHEAWGFLVSYTVIASSRWHIPSLHIVFIFGPLEPGAYQNWYRACHLC